MTQQLVTDDPQQTVQALGRAFYDVVPTELRTHCSFSSRVSRAVLRRLGVESELLPAQLWYVTPSRNYVVGFTGKAEPGQWDGHVVCATRDWIIDAALHHVERATGARVPNLAVAKRFGVNAQVIARCDLNPTDRFWWYLPPPGVDATPCEEPAEIVDRYADALFERLTAAANPAIASRSSPAAGHPAM